MKRIFISLLILMISYVGIMQIAQEKFISTVTPIIIFLRTASFEIYDILRLVQNVENIRQENVAIKKKLLIFENDIQTDKLNNLFQKDKEFTESFFKNSFFINKIVTIHEIIYYDISSSELIVGNFDSSNIKKGDLALLGKNLVGVVLESENSLVRIKLLSRNSDILSTQIITEKGEKINTVVSGEAGDSLVINNILATEDVKPGDIVVTSATNKNIPPDLIIGNIQRIEGISSQTFRKATIKKNYDLNFFKFIGILSL